MTTIATYYNLTLKDWERHAHIACYEVDLQVKQASQRIFYEFAQSTDLNTFISLLNNGSDTLVFVLFSYFSKYPLPFAKIFQNVTYLIQCANTWQFKAFTFIRNNHPPFQKYVTRTIMSTLGIFLKFLYENTLSSNKLLEFIQKLQSNYFKLYLLKSFVDAVEVVDYDLGYMRYRLMVYSFQDHAIPMICQTLMPYFYRIQEGVQINELAFLQQNLNVNDEMNHNHEYHMTITNEQELLSDLVFMILQKIVEFNFNITYSEYQSDQPIETCLISFPDKVSQKILNHQFLNALFFIIQKVSEAKMQEKKHEYLQISLNCVAKMMQSRLTYLKPEVKEKFVYHALKGLTHLLIKCREIGSETLLKGILVCNKKLYMNCELNYLKQTAYKLSQKPGERLYDTYIQSLTNIISLVVSKSMIYTQNSVLIEAIELSNKLIIGYGFRYEENIDTQYTFFMDFVKSIIAHYIHNLFQPCSIFQSFKILAIAESKTMINELFQRFRKLASVNFIYFFERIQQKMNEFMNSVEKSPIIFANILYLLSEIIDHNYLERNILLNQAKNNEYLLLGSIVNKAIQFIKQYVCARKLYPCSESLYVDAAVIIFTQAIFIDFLIGFECLTNFKIKQRLYQFMVYGQYLNQFQQIQDLKSQQTILTFQYILTQYIRSQDESDKSKILVPYCLDAIEKCISKIKWRLRPEVYEKILIVQYLIDFFERLFYNGLSMCEIRSRVAKIITSLTLETLDQYKLRINKFLDSLKAQPIHLIHYDLIGVFQGIESHTIIKYFYTRFNKVISLRALIKNMFQKATYQDHHKDYKDICKFIKILLHNKYFKSQNLIIIYENYKLLLPYLISLLKQINKQNEIDMDVWEPSLFQLLELLKGFACGSHINVFLLQNHTLKGQNQIFLVKQFIIQFIKMLIIISSSIKQYPQLEVLTLSVFVQINKGLLDYIFKDETGQLSYVYALLNMKAIDIAIEYTKMMMHGNKILEEKFIMSIDCLQYYFIFFNQKRKIRHQQTVFNNLQAHYQFFQKHDNIHGRISKNQQLIDALLNFIMTNYKNNLVYLRKIAKLLFSLNQSFNQYIIRGLLKLKIKNEKLIQVENILKCENQESFIDRLKIWVRQIDVLV